MKTFTVTLVLTLSLFCGAEAGFRCFFGNWACSAGCVALGQTSGICDNNDTCFCSENSISIDDIRELLPSRCTMGAEFCQRSCHAIGRRTGNCIHGQGCECSDESLSASEFALCAATSTCRIHCQAQGKATGECDGWSCRCLSQSSPEGAGL